MSVFRIILLSILLVLQPVASEAWAPIGHMAVCYVAYSRLTPAIKARVAELLKLNPDYPVWNRQLPAGTSSEDHDRMIFMMAAAWADDIKGAANYTDDGPDAFTPDGASSSQNIGYSDLFRHQYWHFVDMPFSADHTTLPAIPTPNAETQILAFRAVLGSTAADGLKSYDLVWLLHLVGDIHQPLHATARVEPAEPQGDAGGNKVKLLGDALPNLHAYWDNLPGSDCKFCEKKFLCAQRAEVFGKNVKAASAKASHNLDTKVWVRESFLAAQKDVYSGPIGPGDGPYTIVPESVYDRAAYKVAQKRVALAGARLAEMLNRELK